MAGRLSFHYDRVGDVLHVDLVAPYAGQESDEIEDDLVARSNPRTGAVENLEIYAWSKRFEREDVLALPVVARFLLAE